MNRSHSKAFTLIELLVVISIIALLIGILLPTLGAARNAARDMRCLANFRQFGIGMYGYATEHDDSLPFGQYADYGAGTTNTSGDWMITLSGYFEDTQGTYDAGLEANEAFLCQRASVPGGTKHYSSHPLVMPDLNSPHYSVAPVKLSDVERPTELMAAADGNQITEWVVNPGGVVGDVFSVAVNLYGYEDYMRYSSGDWYMKNDSTDNNAISYTGPDPDGDYPDWGAGNIRWRHGGGQGDVANMLFLDGHAEGLGQEITLNRNIRLDD